MTIPILPVVFTWETAYTYTPRISQSRYNKGVDQRDRYGINAITQEIDVRINLAVQDYVVAEEFLRGRRGLPFRIRSENHFLGDADNCFHCPEWSWSKLGEGLWQLNAKLKQVRILNAG